MESSSARAAIVLGAFLFGTSGAAAGLGAPDLDPIAIAGWRIVVGGTALVIVSWVVGSAPWRHRIPARSLLVGSGTVVAFQAAFFAAVERLGVTQATVLTISTAPVAAALADHVRGRAGLTRRWVAGVALAVGGMVLLSDGGWSLDALGWALALTAGCCFPVYASVLRSLRSDRPDLAAVATVFGGAVPLALVAMLVVGAPLPSAGTESATVVYLGLAATALAYVLWTFGLRVMTVRDTVLLTMVEPVTAAVLAVVLLHESMSVVGMGGIVAIVCGIAIASGVTSAPGRVTVGTAERDTDMVVVASAG